MSPSLPPHDFHIKFVFLTCLRTYVENDPKDLRLEKEKPSVKICLTFFVLVAKMWK